MGNQIESNSSTKKTMKVDGNILLSTPVFSFSLD